MLMLSILDSVMSEKVEIVVKKLETSVEGWRMLVFSGWELIMWWHWKKLTQVRLRI